MARAVASCDIAGIVTVLPSASVYFCSLNKLLGSTPKEAKTDFTLSDTIVKAGDGDAAISFDISSSCVIAASA